VVVEVHDSDLHSRVEPSPAASATAHSGRGLRIVDAISADWGTAVDGRRKAVWFALDLPDSTSRDAEVLQLNDHREPRRGDAGERGEYQHPTSTAS
jgi:hypothetical protein